jgi:hypothetical protein
MEACIAVAVQNVVRAGGDVAAVRLQNANAALADAVAVEGFLVYV